MAVLHIGTSIITMDSCSFIDVAIKIGGRKSIHYFVQPYVWGGVGWQFGRMLGSA